MAAILSLLRRGRLLVLLILVILWGLAFTATHLPGEDLPHFHASDKALHLAGYFSLTSMLLLTLAAFGVPRLTRVAAAVAVMLTYGVLDEYTQDFFGRSTEFFDLVADLIGTYCGVAFWEIVLALLAGRERS